jgi:aldehyde:ferredoxin oxidoreductase
MESSFGWAGQILRVNLSDGTQRIEPSERYYADWLGGRGIGSWILFQEVPSGADALGPENKAILTVGPLVGTPAPASARTSVCTKNALTGGFCASNVGGHFGPELKCAGFDAVVIEGQAQEPVCLFVHDGQAEIMPADSVWGKTTFETEHALRAALGDDRIQVASIGPAGENMVRGACLIVGWGHAAGRGGVGAVFGSKKLKAIAVRGTRPLRVHDTQQFLREVDRCSKKIDQARSTHQLRETGTHFYATGGADGRTPQTWRNFQDASWPAWRAERIRQEVFQEKYEVCRTACFNCTILCGHLYRMEEGPYGSALCDNLHANSVRGLGSYLDVDDAAAILKAHCLCSELGLDVDMAAVTLGWAFELYQRGIIDATDTEGLRLTWGEPLAVIELLERMAHRRGFGDLMANGVARAAAILGRGSDRYAMHVKGAGLNESRLRTHKAWALGVAVSARGGGHLDGAPLTDGVVSAEDGQKLFGSPHVGERSSYEGKAEAVIWQEKLKAVVDMMGLCYYTSMWTDLDLLGPEDHAALFRSATGLSLSADDLMRIGQRLHNVEKAFNTLHAGFSRPDDFLPARFYEEPVKSGPYAGEVLDKDQWSRMLDQYYRLEGWNPATGLQTEACLKGMGLGGVAEELKGQGKLH